MTSPHPRLVLQVFERLCGDKQFWEKLQPPGTVFCRHRIYTLAVVVRLMLVQRLLEGGSLSQAVQRFVQGQGGPGPGPGAISLRTGAYGRARQKLPTLVAIQVLDAIVERLQGWLPSNPILADRPVFVVDGSTLPLPPTAELKKFIRLATINMASRIGRSCGWWCYRMRKRVWLCVLTGAR